VLEFATLASRLPAEVPRPGRGLLDAEHGEEYDVFMMMAQPNLRSGEQGNPFPDEGCCRTSAKAIVSVILGSCSLVAMSFGVPVITLLACCAGVPAIILGMLGLNDIKNPAKRVTGKGMAKTGVALGSLATIVTVISILGAEGREPSRFAGCTNNLKQIGLALHEYASQHGTFPPAARCDANGKPLLSWRVLILPYLEQRDLYDQFHLDEPWDSPHNMPLADRMPRDFHCLTAELSSTSLTTYEVVVGPRSLFTGEPTGVSLASVRFGTTETIMVVEASKPVPWTKPEDLSLASPDPLLGAGSKHPGRFVALMADASVRSIKTSGKDAISPQELRSLVTRDGREAVTLP
jgi:hypothetical protein